MIHKLNFDTNSLSEPYFIVKMHRKKDFEQPMFFYAQCIQIRWDSSIDPTIHEPARKVYYCFWYWLRPERTDLEMFYMVSNAPRGCAQRYMSYRVYPHAAIASGPFDS